MSRDDILLSVVFGSIPILSLNAYFLWGGDSSLWISLPISVIGISVLILFIIGSIFAHELPIVIMQGLFWADFAYIIYRGKFFLLPANTAYIVVALAALLFVVVIPLAVAAFEWRKDYILLKENYDSAISRLDYYREQDQRRDAIRDKLKSSLR